MAIAPLITSSPTTLSRHDVKHTPPKLHPTWSDATPHGNEAMLPRQRIMRSPQIKSPMRPGDRIEALSTMDKPSFKTFFSWVQSSRPMGVRGLE